MPYLVAVILFTEKNQIKDTAQHLCMMFLASKVFQAAFDRSRLGCRIWNKFAPLPGWGHVDFEIDNINATPCEPAADMDGECNAGEAWDVRLCCGGCAPPGKRLAVTAGASATLHVKYHW
jgi:hypothetical protein